MGRAADAIAASSGMSVHPKGATANAIGPRWSEWKAEIFGRAAEDRESRRGWGINSRTDIDHAESDSSRGSNDEMVRRDDAAIAVRKGRSTNNRTATAHAEMPRCSGYK